MSGKLPLNAYRGLSSVICALQILLNLITALRDSCHPTVRKRNVPKFDLHEAHLSESKACFKCDTHCYPDFLENQRWEYIL